MEAIRYVAPEELDDTDFEFRAPLHEVTPLPSLAAPPIATPAGDRTRLSVLGTAVDVLSGEEVLTVLSDTPGTQPRHLCYVNAHSLNLAWSDDAYKRALARAD